MSDLIKIEGFNLLPPSTDGDEPRVRDVEIAERAGLAQPRNVRGIIAANLAELRRHGEVRTRAVQTSEKGGRPSKEYWLNEAQALAVVSHMRTGEALELRVLLVRAFMALRRGILQQSMSADFEARIAAIVQATVTRALAEQTASTRPIYTDPEMYWRMRRRITSTAKALSMSFRQVAGAIADDAGLPSYRDVPRSDALHYLDLMQKWSDRDVPLRPKKNRGNWRPKAPRESRVKARAGVGQMALLQ